MFNDVEKKLKLSFIVNLIVGVSFALFSKKFMKIVVEKDVNGEPLKYMAQSTLSGISNIMIIITVIVSILSVWIAFSIEKDKRAPFKWLAPAGKALRILAWISLVGGLGGAIMFIFWCFFNVVSDNAVVNAISYAIIAIVPVGLMVICFSFFLYGLGNAADGGDATYVQNSKLFDMEPLHTDEDKRKVCPNCGTRTDKHSCPNCGVRVD